MAIISRPLPCSTDLQALGGSCSGTIGLPGEELTSTNAPWSTWAQFLLDANVSNVLFACLPDGNLAVGVPAVRQTSQQWTSGGVLVGFNALSTTGSVVVTSPALPVSNPSTLLTMQARVVLIGMQLFGSVPLAGAAQLQYRWEYSTAGVGGPWTQAPSGLGVLVPDGRVSQTGGVTFNMTVPPGATQNVAFRLVLTRVGTQAGLTIASNGGATATIQGDAAQ